MIGRFILLLLVICISFACKRKLELTDTLEIQMGIIIN